MNGWPLISEQGVFWQANKSPGYGSEFCICIDVLPHIRVHVNVNTVFADIYF